MTFERIVFASVLGLLGWAVSYLIPSHAVDRSFCAPAAQVAAMYWGLPVEQNQAGTRVIRHSMMDVEVGLPCSGLRYYLLVFGLLLWHNMGVARPCNSIKRWVQSGVLLILAGSFAYVMAVLANAARIISVVEVRLLTLEWPGDRWAPSIHVLTGSLVFFSFLIATYWIYEQIHPQPSHAHE